MNVFSKGGKAAQLRAWAARLAAGTVIAGGLAGCSPPPTPNTGGTSSTPQPTSSATHTTQLTEALHQTTEQKYCAAFLQQQTDSDGNTPTFQKIEAENGVSVVMEALPGPALVGSGLNVVHRLYKGIHSGAGPFQVAGSMIASLPEIAGSLIPIPGAAVAADAVTSATNNLAAALGEKPELLPESSIESLQTAEQCDPNAAVVYKGALGRAAERAPAVHKATGTGVASAGKPKSRVNAAAATS